MRLCVHIVENESGSFTAFCPSLPGCKTSGESKAQAREKLDDAIRGYVASINNFVPENLLQEVVEV